MNYFTLSFQLGSNDFYVHEQSNLSCLSQEVKKTVTIAQKILHNPKRFRCVFFPPSFHSLYPKILTNTDIVSVVMNQSLFEGIFSSEQLKECDLLRCSVSESLTWQDSEATRSSLMELPNPILTDVDLSYGSKDLKEDPSLSVLVMDLFPEIADIVMPNSLLSSSLTSPSLERLDRKNESSSATHSLKRQRSISSIEEEFVPSPKKASKISLFADNEEEIHDSDEETTAAYEEAALLPVPIAPIALPKLRKPKLRNDFYAVRSSLTKEDFCIKNHHIIKGKIVFIAPIFLINVISCPNRSLLYCINYTAYHHAQSFPHIEIKIRTKLTTYEEKIDTIISTPSLHLRCKISNKENIITCLIDKFTILNNLFQGLSTMKEYCNKHWPSLLSDQEKATKSLESSINKLKTELKKRNPEWKAQELQLEAMNNAIKEKKVELEKNIKFSPKTSFKEPSVIIFSIEKIAKNNHYVLNYRKYTSMHLQYLYVNCRKALNKTLNHLPTLLEGPISNVFWGEKRNDSQFTSATKLYQKIWEGLEENKLYLSKHLQNVLKDTPTYKISTLLEQGLLMIRNKMSSPPAEKTEAIIIAQLMQAQEKAKESKSTSDEQSVDDS